MHQFHIEDMTCKHCEATVTKAIKALDPDAEITIDLNQHQAQVNSSLERARIAQVICDVGFTPD